jgi:hypothetical protein
VAHTADHLALMGGTTGIGGQAHTVAHGEHGMAIGHDITKRVR